MKRYLSEAIGAAIIVLVGVGVATLYPGPSNIIIGLGFFFAVVLLAYSIGPISGGHANPSVTIGHFFAGKLDGKDTVFYIIAQFIGATIAGLAIYLARGGFVLDGMGSNALQGDLTAIQGGLFELFITFIFVTIILNVTSHPQYEKSAGVIIGLALGVLVMIALPVTGGSLNAARSFGVAIFAGGSFLTQLWIFLVFPTIGGILAGLFFKLTSK